MMWSVPDPSIAMAQPLVRLAPDSPLVASLMATLRGAHVAPPSPEACSIRGRLPLVSSETRSANSEPAGPRTTCLCWLPPADANGPDWMTF